MRRQFLLRLGAGLLGLTAALAFAAPAQAQPASAIQGAERSRVLAQASAALNAQRLLAGRFRQVAPDGSISQGRFYLQRPGRVRFEYDPPAAMLIVADGTIVAIEDRALRSTNRSPLRETPLFFVLKNDINLERDARVTRVVRDGGALLISARDRTGQADGEITLRLEGPQYELRSWDVVDASGALTRIALTQVSRPARVDPRLFRAPAPTAVSPRTPR
ncbi:MAG: outer membrane lipoprotein carrier protein LolA [Hydrogenophilaceae bacterium]|nr:outer membrane lipoprotein carrier protein LolA [Hydrogenophilaceae bacterium]